jgi:WhiB family redox-sensing transcriptional regulator
MELMTRSGRAVLSPTVDAWAWQAHARCRSMDTEFFFSYDGERHGVRARRERAAKQICAQCPVQAECRMHAITLGEYGVWGGTSDGDRRATALPVPLHAGSSHPHFARTRS